MTITINGSKVPVDIRAELEQFTWIGPRWTDTKLIAPSPFRYDNTPSFFVNLETGGWHDSGAVDSEWTSGNFIRLLSFLRADTYEETEDYLVNKYGDTVEPFTGGGGLTLRIPKLPLKKRQETLDECVLNKYKYRHPYLAQRGISEDVQRLMEIGYDRKRRAITIPWRNSNGILAKIKYRSIDSKVFWYTSNQHDLRNLVYGMNVIYQKNIRKAVICEAEIDAMTCMTVGWPAIAIGGSEFTEEKADIIRMSPIEEVVIMADHDEAGQKMKRKVIELLLGYMTVKVVGYPYKYKDINELVCNNEKLVNFINNSKTINKIMEIRKKVW